jgi:hypothetical protein
VIGFVYGQIGVLASDGERVQCHICGKWFGHLGGHVKRAHDAEAADYKAEFGLNATTGLIGPALAKKRREAIHASGVSQWARENLACVLPNLQQWTIELQDRGWSPRPQHLKNPDRKAHLKRIQELGARARWPSV